jgi:hypothetical protein
METSLGIHHQMNKENVLHIQGGILPNHKNNKIMSLSGKQMKLQITMLSKIN